MEKKIVLRPGSSSPKKESTKYSIPPINTTWVTGGITSETIKWARQFGYYLADGYLWSKWDEEKMVGTIRYYFDKKSNEEKKDFCKALSTTKLRRFFGEIRRIQASSFEKEKDSILMLEPKLAYAVGKEEGKGKIVDFYQQLSKALNAIDLSDNKVGSIHFDNFVKILEAVVAYHKAKGGE